MSYSERKAILKFIGDEQEKWNKQHRRNLIIIIIVGVVSTIVILGPLIFNLL